MGDTIEEDLVRAEMIALPITLVLLILVFGSVVAASLPLVVGVMSIVGTFFVLRVLAALTDVSIYALNLTTALGLGLAIDYSLFVVSRYREELRAGHAPRVAVTRTVRTAGRTVAFSALTVAASLCAMLVFPIAFLRSFAYAGVAVALLAGLFSVVVLPAILVLLGHRVNALTLWRRSVTPPEEGFWHRVATVVMRRPIPIATAVVAFLLVLGAPFLGLRLSSPDDRVLPESADVRQVARRAARGVLVRGGRRAVRRRPRGAQRRSGPAEPDRRLRQRSWPRMPSVARVDAATGTYCGAGIAEQLGCQPGQLVLAAGQLAPLRGLQRRRRHLPVGGARRSSPCREAGEDLVARHPRAADAALGRAGHGPVGQPHRHQPVAVRPPAAGARAGRRRSPRCCCS